MNPETTQGSFFFFSLHIPQQFWNLKNHHVFCKKDKRPGVAGLISCHGAGLSILASPTMPQPWEKHRHCQKANPLTHDIWNCPGSFLSHPDRESRLRCKHQPSSYLETPHSPSEPGLPESPAFPSSPLLRLHSLLPQPTGHQAYTHCSTKKTNGRGTPPQLATTWRFFFPHPMDNSKQGHFGSAQLLHTACIALCRSIMAFAGLLRATLCRLADSIQARNKMACGASKSAGQPPVSCFGQNSVLLVHLFEDPFYMSMWDWIVLSVAVI